MARALVACGDVDGAGRAVLEAYAHDVRGHFARHARALLSEGVVRPDAAECCVSAVECRLSVEDRAPGLRNRL